MAASSFPPLHRIARVLVCVASLTACDDQASNPQPLDPGDIRTFVTAEVAEQLAPDGRFALADPSPEPYPQISREQAAEIAVAWARTFGRFHGSYLEGQHGRRIDFNALEIVSPVYYAAGAYEPVPSEAHPGIRNAFGPHYLMYLGTTNQPVLSVAVAAFTQARVQNGQLYYPQQYGSDVVAQGVSPGIGYGVPPSPEQAVRIATSASTALAGSVPTLLMPHRDFLPHHARWRIVLDRPVAARERRSGQMRTVHELYVGLRGELSIPATTQPAVPDEIRTDGGAIPLVRRSARAVVFEPVDLSTR